MLWYRFRIFRSTKRFVCSEQYHAIKADYLEHCRKIGNSPITLKTKERLLYLFLTYLDENNCKSLEYINSSEIIQFSVNIKNKEFYPELRDFLRYIFLHKDTLKKIFQH